MFTLLFQRKNRPYPEIMGGTHVSHAELLATADEVEWVQLISENGKVLVKDTIRIQETLLKEWTVEPITQKGHKR